MAMPVGIPIFDGLVLFPDSIDKSPVNYLFGEGSPTGVPDPIKYVLDGMDSHGVERAVIDVIDIGSGGSAERALREHPDRFVGLINIDPNLGMEALREIDRAVDELDVVGVSTTPSITVPQVPINSNKAYPIYAKCVERDLTLFPLTGVPGPRVPFGAQNVEHLDEVCWFFPELKIVMRHGGEPWVDLAIKLLVKYPNLYYSTSGFTPKHYPTQIIDYANTRGSKKVIYAGHFAMGLTYEKIFSQLPELSLKDEVWPLFLRENLLSVLALNR